MTASNIIHTFDSLDEVQTWALASILEFGTEVRPRGMRTLELFPVAFTLLHPRRRCIAHYKRRWNFPLAIGEFCWHVSGSNALRFIEYYAPAWKEFTDDAAINGSCYGYRVFNKKHGQQTTWEKLIALLEFDSQSRRAILQFFDGKGNTDNLSSKDVPCACSLQFLIRDGRLHAIAHMRSNDAIWGLPYDVFLFTMIQEMLACELNLELGTYSHFAASLHLYERHYELSQKIVESSNSLFFEMPPMQEINQLRDFLELEERVRTDERYNSHKEMSLHKYWRDLLSVLKWYGASKKRSIVDNSIVESDSFIYRALLQNLPSFGK